MRIISVNLSCFLLILSLGSYVQRPIMPDRFRINLNPGKIQKKFEFFQVNYRTPVIDLRGLKSRDNLNIPDSVVVIPPDLTMFDHVVVLIGLSDNTENPTIIVWLAGNYRYKDATFFVDYDQDRNFVNDGESIKIRSGNDPLEVILTPETGDLILQIQVPKIEVKLDKHKVKMVNCFAIGFYAGVGSGALSYKYNDPTSGYSTWYLVKITEKNLSTSITYELKNSSFGLSGSFQNHFYFTSNLDYTKR